MTKEVNPFENLPSIDEVYKAIAERYVFDNKNVRRLIISTNFEEQLEYFAEKYGHAIQPNERCPMSSSDKITMINAGIGPALIHVAIAIACNHGAIAITHLGKSGSAHPNMEKNLIAVPELGVGYDVLDPDLYGDESKPEPHPVLHKLVMQEYQKYDVTPSKEAVYSVCTRLWLGYPKLVEKIQASVANHVDMEAKYLFNLASNHGIAAAFLTFISDEPWKGIDGEKTAAMEAADKPVHKEIMRQQVDVAVNALLAYDQQAQGV